MQALTKSSGNGSARNKGSFLKNGDHINVQVGLPYKTSKNQGASADDENFIMNAGIGKNDSSASKASRISVASVKLIKNPLPCLIGIVKVGE